MGSGKTTVAKLLASSLDRPLWDSDLDLQAQYEASAAQQVEREGTDVLHAREACHLRDALADTPPPVIAAAASVVEDPACRDALADAFVVWLDAPPRVLADRMRDGRHRPHYDPDLEKMLSFHRARRGPWFRLVADLTVDVSDITPAEAVKQILAALARH